MQKNTKIIRKAKKRKLVQIDNKKIQKKFNLNNMIVTRRSTLKLKEDVCYWVMYIYKLPVKTQYAHFIFRALTYTMKKYTRKNYEGYYNILKSNIYEIVSRLKFEYNDVPRIIKTYHINNNFCLGIKSSSNYSFFEFIASADLVRYALRCKRELIDLFEKTERFEDYELDKKSVIEINKIVNYHTKHNNESRDWAVVKKTPKCHLKKK